MKTTHALTCITAALVLSAAPALAKLPAPSDEAKAKAAEANAKTAWGNQVANFQLCKAMDRVAARYQGQAKQAGKEVRAADPTSPCADPGAFVYAAAAPAAPTTTPQGNTPATGTAPPAAAPKK